MSRNRYTITELKRYVPLVFSYGCPALILFVVIYKLLLSLAIGDAPSPQIPPPGHVAEERRVRLTWRRGSQKGNLRVEVALDGKFETPVFSRLTTKTSLLLPQLKQGKRYCWRVTAKGDGRISCFSTQKATVPY